nr:cyclin-dependent protein kinase inhibitor smr13 [Quercus suber]
MAPAPSASRTRYKRKEEPRMELHCGCNASNSVESWNINNGQDYNNGEDISVTVCSTPKAQRFRIPEMLSCPPAPKKRRVTSSFVSDSNIRSPIPFFAPPEIELFFFLALQNIPLSGLGGLGFGEGNLPLDPPVSILENEDLLPTDWTFGLSHNWVDVGQFG